MLELPRDSWENNQGIGKPSTFKEDMHKPVDKFKLFLLHFVLFTLNHFEYEQSSI